MVIISYQGRSASIPPHQGFSPWLRECRWTRLACARPSLMIAIGRPGTRNVMPGGPLVTDGIRAVYGGGERVSGGVVHVRAYTRSRDGRTEHVRAHLRSDPPGGGFDPGAVERAAAPLVAGVPLVIGAGGRVAGQIIRRFPSLARPNLLERILGGVGRVSSTMRPMIRRICRRMARRPALLPRRGSGLAISSTTEDRENISQDITTTTRTAVRSPKAWTLRPLLMSLPGVGNPSSAFRESRDIENALMQVRG